MRWTDYAAIAAVAAAAHVATLPAYAAPARAKTVAEARVLVRGYVEDMARRAQRDLGVAPSAGQKARFVDAIVQTLAAQGALRE
jgi:hypothetical protein